MAKAKKEGGVTRVVNKRKTEDLLKTRKGILIAMTQRAFALAGSKKEGYKGVLSEYSPKSVNGVLYGLTAEGKKKKGKLVTLPEDSEQFSNILSKARAAKADIAADQYTGAVESFIDSVVALEGNRGGGGKRSGAFLADVDL